MATSSSVHRHLQGRRSQENRRRANPWKTQTAPRQTTPHTRQSDDNSGVALPQEAPISPADVLALVALMASAVAALSVTLYGAHYVLSEISSFTTMDVIRMFGGMS
jgi:hypothetical protein